MPESTSAEIISEMLLSLGCVKFSPQKPFLYASGLKGPIYCDNRKILSHVSERDLVANLFVKEVELWRKQGLVFDAIAGLATAGIPHATLLADRLRCPMIYIRSSAKEHGAKNQLEGDVRRGMRLLLVEDLVNQASSLEKACDAAKQAQTFPVGALAIVDYQMAKSLQILSQQGLILKSLTTFQDLVRAAEKQHVIDQNGRDILISWHQNPAKWSSDNSQSPT